MATGAAEQEPSELSRDVEQPTEEELARTLDSMRQSSEIAHVLLGLSGAFGEIATVQETLDKSVRIVGALFGADRCFAAELDAAKGRFEVLAHYGFDSEMTAVLEEFASAGSSGLPLLSQALEQRSPLLVDDVNQSRLPVEDAERRRVRAYLGIPLLRGGREFGGLGVEFSEPRGFGPRDQALARGIMHQVGAALANARRLNLLQSLGPMGLRIGSRLTLSAVAREAAAAAARLLDGCAATLYVSDDQLRVLRASGRPALDNEVAAALATLDLDDAIWAPLRRSESVTVPDLPALVGNEAAPRSMFAAAIGDISGGLFGAVAVFFERDFKLSPDEAEALKVLAAYSASAIFNAQRFERQRRVARSLKKGLRHVEMPVVEGWSIHANYHSASDEADVGGDYYDAFALSDGRVAFVVGDVSGKGAEAAGFTSMAKYMLRAFAMRNPSPSSVLYHLNNALVQGYQDEVFTTVVYGLLDPDTCVARVAIGGHPPPVVWRAAGGEVEVLEAGGSIVGAFENQQFEEIEVEFNTGDKLVAFTDGLLEARSEEGEQYGRERVRCSLSRHSGLDVQELSAQIFADAAEFGTVSDDTLVVAFGCQGGD